MTVLIHVLGSDIPHHNRTVLRFFNDALAATSEHAREFMVVGKDDGLSDSCPALSVQFFPGKKSLAEAVIAKERERLVAFADARTKLIEQQAVIAAL